MSMERCDIAILGGGLAGLSLAVQLRRAGVRDAIAIVEPRTAYEDDRTWCFWATAAHPFADAVAERWPACRVIAPDGTVAHAASRYPYCRLPARAVYDRALAELADAPGVTLHQGTQAASVCVQEKYYEIETNRGRLCAGRVFDGRPPAPGTWPLGRHPFLWQDFVGWRVCTARDVFDPAAVDLMDFRTAGEVSKAAALRFLYVLPLSAREALVETTAFTTAPLAPADHEAHLRAALAARLGGLLGEAGAAYEIISREAGRIPMTTAPPPAPAAPGVVPIGTRAGAPRPSTGYAFLAIQDHARRLAAVTAKGRARPLPVRGAGARWLDRVFLTRLIADPAAAPWLFHRLFARVPPDRLVRFLSECGTPRDHLAVMAALPPGPFAATALGMTLGTAMGRGRGRRRR